MDSLTDGELLQCLLSIENSMNNQKRLGLSGREIKSYLSKFPQTHSPTLNFLLEQDGNLDLHAFCSLHLEGDPLGKIVLGMIAANYAAQMGEFLKSRKFLQYSKLLLVQRLNHGLEPVLLLALIQKAESILDAP